MRKIIDGLTNQQRYEINSPDLARLKHKRAAQKRRDYVNQFKAKPCTDCHIQYNPWQMQFDHLPGTIKIDCVAVLARACGEGLNKERLLQEIAKCEIVCANCHQERSHRRLIERLRN